MLINKIEGYISAINLLCSTNCLAPMGQSSFIFYLQLKNQIAALYSLRAKGTKAFQIDDTPLGWKAIEDQYHRDKARSEQDCVPKVPNLKYDNVYRDVWTRLNVLPAKIMPVTITLR